MEQLKPTQLKKLIHLIVKRHKEAPLIIGVTGNIASGKSTLAQKIFDILQSYSLKTQVVSTDNFLKPNEILVKEGLMKKKGFPESYNYDLINKFLGAIKNNNKITLPNYDQKIHNLNWKALTVVDSPDILILEGLIVLQKAFQNIISETIYIEANQKDNYQWFVKRNYDLHLDKQFHKSQFGFKKLIEFNWKEINLKNYMQNILPYKSRASIYLQMNFFHQIKNYIFK